MNNTKRVITKCEHCQALAVYWTARKIDGGIKITDAVCERHRKILRKKGLQKKIAGV